MTEGLAGDPWRANQRALVTSCRQAFDQSPSLQAAVGILSRWFSVLRTAKYGVGYADSRMKAALADPADNPIAWGSASSEALTPEMSVDLTAVVAGLAEVEHLPATIRYVLGRASMRCMVEAPSGSLGLALAYGLIWPLNHDGIAALAADDELLQQLPGSHGALAEVENEARGLDKTAVARAYKFERERVAQQIRAAAKPGSLEACGHWRVSQLPVDLDFGRVVQVIGSDDASTAARLLDLIGNPALVAAVLAHFSDEHFAILSDLLPRLRLVFGAEGRWTGATAAWMVLMVLEARFLACLEQQSGAVRLSRERPAAPEAIIRSDLDFVTGKLLSRNDGGRLALEWLAHLSWPLLLDRRQPSAPGGEDLRSVDPRQVLTGAVSARLAGEDWARPVRVWGMFGGAPLVKGVTKGREQEFGPPAWTDWLGQRNTLVPVAVAVQLWNADLSPSEWLVPWIRSVCRELGAGADARQLAEAGSSVAADLFAWPLVRSDQPLEQFNELWAEASWRLTRARFSPLDEAADRVRPCVAILRVGLRMLALAREMPPAHSIGELATSLADAVDEVRYTLPEMGVGNWPALSGSLAGAMAANGLLEGDGCARLLSRYLGDDACLAAAAVNAVANGLPNSNVRCALATLGEDAAELAARWARWDDRLAGDGAGGPSGFLRRLRAISGSGPEA